MTHYETLGVAHDATQAAIRASYLALARRHHPDVRADESSQAQMRRINEAWAVLGDEARRDDYDREVRAAVSADWRPGRPTPDFVPYDDADDPDDPAEEFDIPYGDGAELPRSLQMGPAWLVLTALVAGGTGALLGFTPLVALGLVLGALGMLGFLVVPVFAAVRAHRQTNH